MSAASIALRKNNRATIEYLWHGICTYYDTTKDKKAMMGKPDFDAWFYSLDVHQLLRMFHCPSDWEVVDFIDECDEAWNRMTEAKREDLYNKYH